MSASPAPRSAGAGWSALVRPRMLLLHVAAAAAVAATALLGLWQLHAWQYHREDRAAGIADQPPVPLGTLIGPDDAFPRDGVGRPVRVAGEWVRQPPTYAEGRSDAGKSGYWVLGSLAVCAPGSCADAAAVPVVIGWSATTSRPPMPTGRAEVTGWLQPGESGDVDPHPGDDVLPSVQIADLLERSDRDLYSGYVILDRPASDRSGLDPVTPASLPKPSASVGLRNLLYAIQWWVFGGFAIFLWGRWCRDEMVGRAPAEEHHGADSVGEQPARIPSGA